MTPVGDGGASCNHPHCRENTALQQFFMEQWPNHLKLDICSFYPCVDVCEIQPTFLLNHALSVRLSCVRLLEIKQVKENSVITLALCKNYVMAQLCCSESDKVFSWWSIKFWPQTQKRKCRVSQLHSEETPHIRYRQIWAWLRVWGADICLLQTLLPDKKANGIQRCGEATGIERNTDSDISKNQACKLMITTGKWTGMAYCKTCKYMLLKISSAYLLSFATEKEKSSSYCEQKYGAANQDQHHDSTMTSASHHRRVRRGRQHTPL